jgi:hypothetical protein
MRKINLIIIVLLALWTICAFAQEDVLIFSHKYHAEEIGASCTDCHESVETSTSPTDNLLPSMETCYNCHDEDESECSLCHSNADEAVEVARIVDMAAAFSHQVHIEEGQECLDCHSGVENKNEPTAGQHIPDRQACTECHGSADFSQEKDKCLTCHSDIQVVKPADHLAGWKKDHGAAWEINEQTCSHCHSNFYCQECHQGDNLDREVHPLNFRNNHGIEAKANKENCITCHREYAFCNECHAIEMVMPKNHSYAGWSNTTTGGQHAKAAQYDFDYCQSCHSDLTGDVVCMTCHGK